MPIELWLFTITDPLTGKRRRTRHRMTIEEARDRHGDDAQPVEGSRKVRKGGDYRGHAPS